MCLCLKISKTAFLFKTASYCLNMVGCTKKGNGPSCSALLFTNLTFLYQERLIVILCYLLCINHMPIFYFLFNCFCTEVVSYFFFNLTFLLIKTKLLVSLASLLIDDSVLFLSLFHLFLLYLSF